MQIRVQEYKGNKINDVIRITESTILNLMKYKAEDILAS